jgi:hypothetical protein
MVNEDVEEYNGTHHLLIIWTEMAKSEVMIMTLVYQLCIVYIVNLILITYDIST